MPPNPNLDRLLELVGVLGADAAWLLRGCDEASLTWFEDNGTARSLAVYKHQLGESFPAILVARFPAAGSPAEPEPVELKLPPGRDREIQAAALVSAAIDALSQIGPHTTLRVLKWVFDRYGIEGHPWTARDRRPKTEPAAPAQREALVTAETTRFDPAADRGAELRAQRLALGVSQMEVSKRVGLENLPRGRLSLIERGKLEVDDATWSLIEIALIELRKERQSWAFRI